MTPDAFDELRMIGVPDNDPRIIAARDAAITRTAGAAAQARWIEISDSDELVRRTAWTHVARIWLAHLLTISPDAVLAWLSDDSRHHATGEHGESWRSAKTVTLTANVSTGLRVLDDARLTVELVATGTERGDTLRTIALVGHGVRITDRNELVTFLAERARI